MFIFNYILYFHILCSLLFITCIYFYFYFSLFLFFKSANPLSSSFIVLIFDYPYFLLFLSFIILIFFLIYPRPLLLSNSFVSLF